ncbi:aldehyde dehydrogenase family protein [Pediococcus argentinicus]|uniref:Acetaldehyde dehydrogenase n=1 Tax=Pediococcus argentinicus TaxID=480391 RepID=A0A0R2NCF8_9LACO|nr:aldehyde dehydrogenase family protein [Pediococcus argentinicus]KRO23510.1 acetaldehyde dehydrogenase [Pediococcus argentinicus]NKZ22903.1 aldehyde dehydrogenase family protein [Pediococcus argentinicus]GEP19942.1 acetaldehyde dehydrogenase [Pediococcus argentinicus]
MANDVKENSVQESINTLVVKGHKALDQLAELNQEQIDAIVKAMAKAGFHARSRLAKMAVEETGRGVYEDKVLKNQFATLDIYHSIQNDKTVGIISDDKETGIMKVAEPVGVVASVTPVTNPTSTVFHNALLAIKTRNPIIFGFHPFAQKSCVEAGKIILNAAVEAGAPADCIQWIAEPSMDATSALMNHEGIATIVATGGSAMVKAAYSTGKPALGVGPGNVPVYIEKSADIQQSIDDIVISKSFDNGMICASESNLIVDAEVYDQVKEGLQKQGAYFVKPEDMESFTDVVMSREKHSVNPRVAGQPAAQIAEWANIKDCPSDAKFLVAEVKSLGGDEILSHEKLSPVLAMVSAKDQNDAMRLLKRGLYFGGLGHTAGLHTNDDALINRFALEMNACRLLINTPTSQGAIGYRYNNVTPSMTLGCGSWGKNSISHNLEDWDLLNIKTVAKRLPKLRHESIDF